jgi:hypothetical protein
MDTPFCSFRVDLLLCLTFKLLLEVFDDAVRDAPPDEVELGDGRHETLELDAGRSAEWVEELLRVPVQARLVRDVDGEDLAVRGSIGHVFIFRVVRHEPLKPAKGRRLRLGGPTQNRVQLLTILRDFKEPNQTREKKFRLIH